MKRVCTFLLVVFGIAVFMLSCDLFKEDEIYVPQKYKIIYKDKGGADFSGVHDNGYPKERIAGKVTQLKSATKDGNTFGGWFENSGCAGTSITSIPYDVTNDVTLYALWIPKTYKVTLHIDETTTCSDVTEYSYGTVTRLPDLTSDTGVFHGWYADENHTSNRITEISATETGDKEYWAWWSDKVFITWNPNGGKIGGSTENKTFQISIGATCTSPTGVEKTGHTLDGWYNNPDFTGSPVNDSTTYTDDVTLYAKWTPKVYNVTLHTNGGTINRGYIDSYTYGIGATLPTDITTTTNYIFDGWYANEACTGDKITEISPDETGDKVYYAKWLKLYTLTWNLNGGTITSAEGTYTTNGNYTSGTKINAPTVEKEGHTLTWNPEVPERITNSDLSFTADWTPEVYTITYKDKGGGAFSGTTETDTPATHTYGSVTTLKGATKTGYTFGGWCTDTDCNLTSITSIGATDYTGNITLYANWIPEVYRINYYDKGGADFSGNNLNNLPQTHTYNSATNLIPAKTATDSAFEFGGWCTDTDCNLPPVTVIGATSYTDDFPLYANWVEKVGTITVKVTENGIQTADRYCVQLKKFGSVYKISFTDSSGEAVFTDVSIGTYNVFAQKNKTSETNLVDTGKVVSISLAEITTSTELFYYSVTLTTDTGISSVKLDNVVQTSDCFLKGKNVTISATTATGYRFAKWTDSNNSDTEFSTEASTIVNITQAVSYKANSIQQFAVTVTSADTSVGTVNNSIGLVDKDTVITIDGAKLKIGSDVKATATTVTDGYKFVGWYVADAEQTAHITVTADMTITAKWAPEVYTIKYKDEGGGDFSGNNLDSLPQTHTYNSATNLVPATTTTDGIEFKGWYKNSDFSDANPVTSLGATEYTTDLTLYAKWAPEVYTITYKDKGGADFSGTTETDTPSTHTYGIVTTLKGATKPGYTFGGWCTDTDCNLTSITSIGATEYTTNLTLYANWIPEVYRINYYDKGGADFSGDNLNSLPQTHTYNSATNLVPATTTTDGIEFKGWYKNSDFSDANPVTSLGATEYTTNLTLYAKWGQKATAFRISKDGSTYKYYGTYETNPTASSDFSTSVTQEEAEKAIGTTTPVFGEAKGYVFYKLINGTDGYIGQYTDCLYLEAAPSNVDYAYFWGDFGAFGTKDEIGEGKSNTEKISENESDDWRNDGAYQIKRYGWQCNDFSDWFVPSKDELGCMYSNLHTNYLGNFGNPHEAYWSSSERSGDTSSAWCYSFYWNTAGFSGGYYPRNMSGLVRACRAF